MELTAEDVKYSIERSLQPEIIFNSVVAAEIAPLLIGVEIIDKDVIRLDLKRPAAQLLEKLSDYLVALPREVYEGNEDRFNFEAVGSGPFKFVRKTGTEEILFEANEDYWDKTRRPRFGNLTMKVISEPANRWAALKSGEIDFARFDGTTFVKKAEKEVGE